MYPQNRPIKSMVFKLKLIVPFPKLSPKFCTPYSFRIRPKFFEKIFLFFLVF